MKGFDAARTRKPAWLLAIGVTLALTVGMVYLRVAAYPHRIVPLAYALPLLVGLWHRDRVLLWAMAICFMVVAAAEVIWLIPDGFFDDSFQQFLFTTMQWLNIVVPAGVVHLILIYRQRLEQGNESLATANEELEASNEELAAREEEISRQNEELQSQTEELEQQAEEELRQSRERLAWVLDTTGVGLWLNELPLDRLNWDSRTRELFFIPPGVEPTIELFWDRLHPDDREPTRLAVEAALRDRTLYAIDHRAINPKTGEVRWIRSAGQGIYVGDGHATRFDGINYDITERKQAEEERLRLLDVVAQEKDQLSALVNSITDEIWFVDTEGGVTLTNPSVAREFGLSLPDATDVKQLAESLEVLRQDRNPRPVEEAPPLRALRGEVVRNLEETVRTPATGELRHRQVSSSPVRDAKGNIIGSVSVVRDITEQKRREERIAKLTRLYAVLSRANEAIVRASRCGSSALGGVPDCRRDR